VPLILAVDDDQSGLHFRKLILEHAGYSVLSSTRVEEALELYRTRPIDLVLTDHLLGRQVGTEMARAMKRIKPSVPIILLSGTAKVPDALAYADAFLTKSEGPEALLEIISKLIRLRPPPDQPEPTKRHAAAPLQELLAGIVEDSDDAILSKTLDGSILTWNKAAERAYGYRAEEVIGQNVSILLPPDRPQELDEILERLKRGEKIEHFETTRRTKDGRVLNVSLTISPVRDAEGHIIGASSIARDITPTKLAEEALRNSERLAVAGRMAATIAHEINNPLETVTNILYLVARNPSLDETGRQYLKMADEELKRVGQITRTTLGFYRERDAAAVPVTLSELIESLLFVFQRQVASLGVTVEKRFHSTGKVPAVMGELRQVFANLLANALDALAVTGSKLVVHVRDSRDWRDFDRRGIRVTLCDDGPGMAPEARSHLFTPFYTTKGRRGTGIGLWVSRGIIAKHQGSIRVRSNTHARHGTCFEVFLPRQEAAS
jgi:two-component system CheB/CheR fusion protein